MDWLDVTVSNLWVANILAREDPTTVNGGQETCFDVFWRFISNGDSS